jgi:alanyl-tRNA synthetase
MATTLELDELRNTFLRFFESKGHLVHPSASLKSDDPTLMFNVAGMQQFKAYFQGATPRFPGFDGVWPRVVTSQKCMRAGGKDSDIENVGRTRRHHTFFEMLGNFSFGDYFKAEAAAWAWEFLTDPAWLGLDPDRLWVTVFTDDDEAYRIWTEEVGVPAERVSRFGEAENFWPANAVKDGRSGPCGPCSEIFFDRGPGYGSPDETGPNTGAGDRFMEIWNLVFTQFDLVDGELRPLPMQNIDTGMGFERLASVVSGARDAYGSELFGPSIRLIEQVSGQAYRDLESVEHRIIADHARSVTMCITDGVLPANDGAGYVIKMLIRRAARQAWKMGVREPLLHRLVDTVAESMGGAYPAVRDQRTRVAAIVKAEEEHFLTTLEAGIERVALVLDGLDGGVLAGAVAFDLWQTYGFPLDLTVEMAAERGVEVDRAGYTEAREAARAVSRAGGAKGALFGAAGDAVAELAADVPATVSLAHEALQADATVQALVVDGTRVGEVGEGASVQVVLDRTPCYPEGGGQVGDAAKLTWPGGAIAVTHTGKTPHGHVLHAGRVVRGRLATGADVHVVVDPARRETEKHHTATHLLHAALRQVLGDHVAQAGSLVAPDRLRFDLSHGAAITPEQLERIERLANAWIQADLPVTARVVPIAEARDEGAMMLFGEKYGERVRMVRVGADAAPSIELCGGTHVRRTGEIGALLLTGEEAAAAGVRRVEAVAGVAAVQHLQSLRAVVQAGARALGATPDAFEARIAKLQADLRAAQREAAQLRDRLAAAQTGGAAGASDVREAGGFRYASAALEGLDASALRNAADTVLQKTGADVVVLGSGQQLVVKVSEAAQARGAHAGRLIKALAQRGGGGGGGRPDMAQAGVRDDEGLRAALAAVHEVLTA